MTATENRPGVGSGTAEVLAGGLNTSTITPNYGNPAEPAAKIGATVEKHLAAALARLQADEISLDACTASLAGFYLAGHAAALASVLPELTRVEQERDRAQSDATRYYNAAFSPRQPINFGPSYADLERTRHEMMFGGESE